MGRINNFPILIGWNSQHQGEVILNQVLELVWSSRQCLRWDANEVGEKNLTIRAKQYKTRSCVWSHWSARLSAFQKTEMQTLSGGQASRLTLRVLCYSRPFVLRWATTGLDIQTESIWVCSGITGTTVVFDHALSWRSEDEADQIYIVVWEVIAQGSALDIEVQ